MPEMTPKNPAAVSLGRKGGQARAEKLTPEQRSESARKASEARWAKTKKLVAEIKEGAKRLEEKNRAALRRLARQKKGAPK